MSSIESTIEDTKGAALILIAKFRDMAAIIKEGKPAGISFFTLTDMADRLERCIARFEYHNDNIAKFYKKLDTKISEDVTFSDDCVCNIFTIIKENSILRRQVTHNEIKICKLQDQIKKISKHTKYYESIISRLNHIKLDIDNKISAINDLKEELLPLDEEELTNEKV